MITAHCSERHAVDALHRGAIDYFKKPFEPDELGLVLRRTLRSARLLSVRDQLSDELALARTMVFASPAMTDLARLATDLHRRIDDFVDLVTRNANEEDRTAKVHADMYDYFLDEVRAHGFEGSDDEIREVVGKDVILNTMGLEFWLDHAQ